MRTKKSARRTCWLVRARANVRPGSSLLPLTGAHQALLLALVQKKLFVAARESELCYLIRIAEGGLRIGAVVTTVLSALAKAFVLHHLYTEGVPAERAH